MGEDLLFIPLGGVGSNFAVGKLLGGLLKGKLLVVKCYRHGNSIIIFSWTCAGHDAAGFPWDHKLTAYRSLCDLDREAHVLKGSVYHISPRQPYRVTRPETFQKSQNALMQIARW